MTEQSCGEPQYWILQQEIARLKAENARLRRELVSESRYTTTGELYDPHEWHIEHFKSEQDYSWDKPMVGHFND